MKDTHVVSFSPMHHWTEHNIRVHVFTCVLALQLAHLMRLRATRARLRMSVRELLRELAGIGETILLYHGDRGRPRAHRMLTETTPVQDKLTSIFGSPATPPSADMGNTPKPAPAPWLTSRNSRLSPRISETRARAVRDGGRQGDGPALHGAHRAGRRAADPAAGQGEG